MWSHPLHEWSSAPLCLEDGNTVVTGPSEVLFLDTQGRLQQLIELPYHTETGGSPNLSADGALFLGAVQGNVMRVQGQTVTVLGNFGYNVLNPAIYADGGIGLAGYSDAGISRVNADGEVRWQRASLRDADGLVTLNRWEELCVHDLNERRTYVLNADGLELFFAFLKPATVLSTRMAGCASPRGECVCGHGSASCAGSADSRCGAAGNLDSRPWMSSGAATCHARAGSWLCAPTAQCCSGWTSSATAFRKR